MESKHIKNMKILQEFVKELPKVSSARIGAMIRFGKGPYFLAGNSVKSHPFQAKYAGHIDQIYLHAEINAIHQATNYSWYEGSLNDCTLYVCRLAYEDSSKKVLKTAMSKPCIGCMRCIAEFGLRDVIYTSGNLEEPLKYL